MKLFTFIGLFLISTMLQAQQLIFDKTIAESNVQESVRLKEQMKSHYRNSRYTSQVDFFQPNDFFIFISPELIVKSKFKKMHQYPTGSGSYEGKVEGAVGGDVTFSKFNDRIAGMISLDDGRKFIIDQMAPNLFAVSLALESSYTQKESLPDFIEAISSENTKTPNAALATSICDIGNTCASPSIIDLMIVYTQLAETNWGGNSNTVANITQAVTNMNVSMTNSGVNNVTFRLVHTEKMNYTESGNFSTDLSRLSGTSDGFMDNVHPLRDQYGADMISLIIGSPTSSCGIGYLNTSSTNYSASSGFNVSLYSCVVGNYTMAHEFGHNMGLRHDWYVDASTTPCSHHHGYTNRTAIIKGASSLASERWRTIMAYNNECADLGFNCSRLNRWANPSVQYNGDPTGVAIGNSQPSDEAYAFYRMACLVAAFRAEPGACPAPTGLTASSITTSGATVSWNSVSSANNYDVEYKAASSGIWIAITPSTVSTSVNLGGLTSATLYDWRVKANCTELTSSYSTSQFTTASSSSPCPGSLDISTNGIISGAAIIPFNIDVKGTISPKNDNDYYKFTITNPGTITITLTTLPANYQLALVNSAGTQLAISQNNGTANETISYTAVAGIYYARVFPRGNVSNATSCYTLKVLTGTASDFKMSKKIKLNLFPNPATNQLNVWMDGIESIGQIKIYDSNGKLVMQQQTGSVLTQLNISKLSAGYYLLSLNDGKQIKSSKFIKK